jgi:hypothetical protein
VFLVSMEVCALRFPLTKLLKLIFIIYIYIYMTFSLSNKSEVVVVNCRLGKERHTCNYTGVVSQSLGGRES